jgi:hypothetical protein
LDYTVDVATNVTEVVVTATKADPNAVISGDLPNEGQATIPLDGPGTSRVISIIVTAQDTVTTKTYRITVNRAASSNNNLAALTVTPPGTLPPPGFVPSTLDYTVDVATNVTETATKSDPNATMSALGSVIAPPGTLTGTTPVLLGTTVEITVIAQDAVTNKIYTITFSPVATPSS